MLDFYNTEAVKAFTLKTLIENRELNDEVSYERRQSNEWFHRFQEAEKKNAGVEKAVAILDNAIDAIDTDVIPGNPEEAKKTWDLIVRCLTDASAALKGGPKNE